MSIQSGLRGIVVTGGVCGNDTSENYNKTEQHGTFHIFQVSDTCCNQWIIPRFNTGTLKLRFYIPAGTWEFHLHIHGCHQHSSHRFPETESLVNVTYADGKGGASTQSVVPCIRNVFLRPRALPRYKSDGTLTTITENVNSEFSHLERLPYTDSYYYILIVTERKASYNIAISVKGNCLP